MMGLFETVASPGAFPVADIARIDMMTKVDGRAPTRKLRLKSGGSFDLFEFEVDELMRRPMSITLAEPGWRLVSVNLANPEASFVDRLVGWAICMDGRIRPVGPSGIENGLPNFPCYAMLPDGRCHGTDKDMDGIQFDSFEKLVANCKAGPTDGPEDVGAASTPLTALIAQFDAATKASRDYCNNSPGRGHRGDMSANEWEQIKVRSNELAEIETEALMAIERYRCTTAAEIKAKFALLERTDDEDVDHWRRMIRDLLAMLPETGDPHMDLLAKWSEILADYDASCDVTDGDGGDPSVRRELFAIEKRISETPARTRDGLLAKAIVASSVNINVSDVDIAASVVADARAMGLISMGAA